MGKARILCFTGEGKGKTTAALGMGLRAVGHGMRVLAIQFVKGDPKTGELAAIQMMPGFRIIQTGRGFIPAEGSGKFQEHREAARGGLRQAAQALKRDQCDVLILDEICVAVAKKLLEEREVLNLLELAGSGKVVVMTGRNASFGLMQTADTVTEMRKIKHGFDSGIKARQGVEF